MEKVISLHFVGGGSDKVYDVQLLETKPGKWSCTAQYGRRGGRLSDNNRVVDGSYSAARDAYDTVVSEKLRKGYKSTTPSGRSVRPAPSVPASVVVPPGLVLESFYAEAAEAFDVPTSMKLGAQPWVVLLADVASGLQDGLADALASVRNCATDAETLALLSPATLDWFSALPREQRDGAAKRLRVAAYGHISGGRA